MAKDSMEWLDAIAVKAKVNVARVEQILATRHIVPTPVLPTPRRMKLLSIMFGGEKQEVEDEGPFTFYWDDLREGLWGMITDRNLRGKSSIMEVVRWLLRGKPSPNMQDDVKAWIHKAALCFDLDGVKYEIKVECKVGTSGFLSRQTSSASEATIIASFNSEKQFETVMSDFFLHAFSMESIATWRTSDSEDKSGQTVMHGWPALSGAMFIGTNYDVILGDLPATTGTQARLMQMYLGVPWVSTHASAIAAQKLVDSSIELDLRRRNQLTRARQLRVAEIEAELDKKIESLNVLPSDEMLQTELSQLSKKYADTKRRENAIQERLNREKNSENQINADYIQDRRDLQAHKEYTAAGSIFRMLDPTCCPRCDHEIDSEKKKKEALSHTCSVCGEIISNDEDVQNIKERLEANVKASKMALGKIQKAKKQTEDNLVELQTDLICIENRSKELTEQLGTFDTRKQLLQEIAVLKGRLEEARFEPNTTDITDNESAVLKAIVAETELRSKTVRDEFLKEVSKSLLRYAKSFGMHSLSKAHLRGNASLVLIKGGADTSFSKVTKGERLRLKVATVLAMIQVGEERGIGRHPGLIMIDSPAAQEIAPEDLRGLLSGLQMVRKELPHLQIFVAGVTSPAMLEFIAVDQRKEASNGGYLW